MYTVYAVYFKNDKKLFVDRNILMDYLDSILGITETQAAQIYLESVSRERYNYLSKMELMGE